MLAYNLNRGADNVRLFEAGSVFELAGASDRAAKRICMGDQPVRATNAGWSTLDGGFSH